MTEDEKKKQEQQQTAAPAAQPQTPAAADTSNAAVNTDAVTTPAAPAQPAIYGGSYDNQIRDLFTQITNTQPFNYDVNGDALFQQYKDQYTRQAQDSMRDTLAQTAQLTGGYGNSYGHMAGQQIYDRTMQGLTDKIPELANQAYTQYQGQLGQLKDNLSMAGTLGAQEQATQKQNYSNLYQLITTTGYNPTPEELAAAGITQDQADMLRFTWAQNLKNPEDAVRSGAITKDEYKQLTGKTFGKKAGGYAYEGGPGKSYKEEVWEAYQKALERTNDPLQAAKEVNGQVQRDIANGVKDATPDAVVMWDKGNYVQK